MDSKIADINNNASNSFAGAIHAALFLQEFVKPGTEWAHFDLYAWNASPRPGRPVGGEAFALRGLFHMLKARYGR
jgi:leucyl aminopeptidase